MRTLHKVGPDLREAITGSLSSNEDVEFGLQDTVEKRNQKVSIYNYLAIFNSLSTYSLTTVYLIVTYYTFF